MSTQRYLNRPDKNYDMAMTSAVRSDNRTPSSRRAQLNLPILGILAIGGPSEFNVHAQLGPKAHQYILIMWVSL